MFLPCGSAYVYPLCVCVCVCACKQTVFLVFEHKYWVGSLSLFGLCVHMYVWLYIGGGHNFYMCMTCEINRESCVYV